MATKKMLTRRRSLTGICALAIALSWTLVHGDPQGQSFTMLAPGYTQQLFGVTSNITAPSGVLGGVAVLQNGDVLAVECATDGTRLHRFEASATFTSHGSTLHLETVTPIAGGCGIVVHNDGTLYL